MEFPQIDKDTSFAILGLGKFGMSVAKELSDNDFHILCCDKSAMLVHEIANTTINAVQADISDSSVLYNLGIRNYDIVIVAFSDDFEAELLTTMILKEMGVSFVLAKANGYRQKKILENIGADMVVMPEIETGKRIAQKIITNDPIEYIHRSDDYEIVELQPKREWVGKTLFTLDLRKNHKLNVIALIRDDKVVPDLSAESIIKEHDQILAVHFIQ